MYKAISAKAAGNKTVGEWFDANPDASARVVWAADAKGGFGKKGWPVYGNNDDLEIVEAVALTNSNYELRVWNPAWGQI